MLDIIRAIKTQFADNATIISLVGTRCSFVVELQQAALPFIAYNIKQEENVTKDGCEDFTLTIAVVAENVTDLLTIYDACKTVINTEVSSFYKNFEGSSYPDKSDKDDHYIIELNYNIQTL